MNLIIKERQNYLDEKSEKKNNNENEYLPPVNKNGKITNINNYIIKKY